ncbi:MAG TPA: hypothetical protein VFY93_10425 [Planctomycetota bacterium]|nr:hypothetical protein [Planctomycetota bacterium]
MPRRIVAAIAHGRWSMRATMLLDKASASPPAFRTTYIEMARSAAADARKALAEALS